jgi:hypothetical protein
MDAMHAASTCAGSPDFAGLPCCIQAGGHDRWSSGLAEHGQHFVTDTAQAWLLAAVTDPKAMKASHLLRHRAHLRTRAQSNTVQVAQLPDPMSRISLPSSAEVAWTSRGRNLSQNTRVLTS